MSTTRTMSAKVQITEKITPYAGAQPIRVLHSTGALKSPVKRSNGLAHSGLVSSATTWNLNALTHSSGAVRDYSGKRLKSITIASDGQTGATEVVVTLPGGSVLRVRSGGVLFQPLNLLIVSGNTLVISPDSTTAFVLLEFDGE